MNNRTTVDRLTYLTILANQERHYRKTESPDRAMLLARQAVAAAFVCDEDVSDLNFQKDHDDAKREDWTS